MTLYGTNYKGERIQLYEFNLETRRIHSIDNWGEGAELYYEDPYLKEKISDEGDALAEENGFTDYFINIYLIIDLTRGNNPSHLFAVEVVERLTGNTDSDYIDLEITADEQSALLKHING